LSEETLTLKQLRDRCMEGVLACITYNNVSDVLAILKYIEQVEERVESLEEQVTNLEEGD
jgi:hypothetical protein